MLKYQLGQMEARFADIVWENEPVKSGDLVKICEKEMNWKKPTVYTVLRKLCQRGIFKNEASVVTSIISKEQFVQMQSKEFVENNFKGSLPGFLTAFIGSQKISKRQAEELKRFIDEYEEKG